MREDQLIDALIGELGGSPVVQWQPGGRYGLISSFADRIFDPPARLDFDLVQLVRHLDHPTAGTLFPHIQDPLRRAFVQFAFHLEEELATHVISGSVIRLIGGVITVDPVRDPRDLLPDLPPGKYEWGIKTSRPLGK
ncbi:hypothetical protein JL107_17660 [Nakamurella flavida]|uniref:Uncharacterized protein n=1 Tax=Nakamurella flavida TaxID=363630 RepID=A0A938YP24_9ACTN|nr:hypothetical protein [Nakamurella flavida]MBM9478278.1 hypothetical protein [Nakamurella flavida]MDP9777551.1 hypothetical protein [Nakamurella flavida]